MPTPLLTNVTPERPARGDVAGLQYLRSYLLIRLVIGALGFFLPISVVVGALLLGDDEPWKGSISAYYHSGVGDLFVGALSVTGLFLIAYMAFEANRDNTITMVAGVAAFGVAFLPTGGAETPTPLQERLGESVVGSLHFLSAAVFILSLASMCFMFGTREGRRQDGGRTPEGQRLRKAIHRGCAWVIWAVVAGFLLVKLAVGLDRLDESLLLVDKSLFLTEAIAVAAFGISWFFKGTELRLLLGEENLERSLGPVPGESPGGAPGGPESAPGAPGGAERRVLGGV